MNLNKNKKQIVEEFINTLPSVNAVYGYGSGLLKQIGIGSKEGQIDLIVVVDDAREFHIKNMSLNPSHYSKGSKNFFTKMPMKLQKMGADICYIPYIKYSNYDFKMGIISREDFISDLKEWKNMYMAGRFQKPIVNIKTDEELDLLIDYNRKAALLISLLMLKPEQFNLYELYKQITSISYNGDIRQGINIGNVSILNFENPNKINNLIAGNYKRLNEIYYNSRVNNSYFKIEENINFNFEVEDDLDEINKNSKIIEELKKIQFSTNQFLLLEALYTLPFNLKYELFKADLLNNNYNKEELQKIRDEINKFIFNTNRKTTVYQSLKGLMTAGLDNSLSYLLAKAKKAQTKKLVR